MKSENLDAKKARLEESGLVSKLLNFLSRKHFWYEAYEISGINF